VELVYEVERAVPFHITTEVETKFEPVAVMFVAALPATDDDGLIDVSEGVGVVVRVCMWLPLPPHATRLNRATSRTILRGRRTLGKFMKTLQFATSRGCGP
jgi:hypothetical protein